MNEPEIVRVASAGTLQEAHAWRMALEQEGIRCQVVGEYLTAGYGMGVLPNEYPEVWVHRADLEKAKAVLDGLGRARKTS
jgi:hypothetical protein